MSDEQVSAKQVELDAAQEKADKVNEGRSGVGTRVRVGQTRGKASMVISWEAFDKTQPDTLPKSLEDFSTITGVTDEDVLVDMLIDGYNDAQYIAASDPIAEYVEDSWPDETKAQFRLVVRNYSRGAKVSIEEAAALLKPGIDAGVKKAAQPVGA